MIGAIVLAAGLSSRLPANKLLMPLKGKPLVRYAVEAALGSQARPVVVVIGNAAAEVREALADFTITLVENCNYTRGLSESLKVGVRSLPFTCRGALVLLGDMPDVSAATIDELIARFDPAANRTICVPVRAGRRGNPVLWGRRHFPEILALQGDHGAKSLIDKHADTLCEVAAADNSIFSDIDTADDLAAHE